MNLPNRNLAEENFARLPQAIENGDLNRSAIATRSNGNNYNRLVGLCVGFTVLVAAIELGLNRSPQRGNLTDNVFFYMLIRIGSVSFASIIYNLTNLQPRYFQSMRFFPTPNNNHLQMDGTGRIRQAQNQLINSVIEEIEGRSSFSAPAA